MAPRANGEIAKARSPRNRALVIGGLVVVALGLVVLLSQLGGPGGGTPLNAVAAAAVKTQEVPGGRAIMHMSGSSASGKSFTVTGRMAFNSENRVRAVLRFAPAGSTTATRMEMIGDRTVIYMRSPRLKVPEGRKWMKVDLEAAIGLKVPVPRESDPRGELALLEAAGNVRKLGKEKVRGVATTHYRGTLGVPETLERLREEGEEELAEKVAKTAMPLHFEVWIDSKGLVRQMRIFNLHSSQDTEANTAITLDFFDFGFEPQIEPPASSEVFDATSLAESH